MLKNILVEIVVTVDADNEEAFQEFLRDFDYTITAPTSYLYSPPGTVPHSTVVDYELVDLTVMDDIDE